MLTSPVPEHGLEPGDAGTVVLVHRDGEGFEVELTTLAYETLAAVTVPRGAARPVGEREIAHARGRLKAAGH